MVRDSVDEKLLTAMMLLETCERRDDPHLMDKIDAIHSYVQSARIEMNGGSQVVSESAQNFVATMRADWAIKDARAAKRY